MVISGTAFAYQLAIKGDLIQITISLFRFSNWKFPKTSLLCREIGRLKKLQGGGGRREFGRVARGNEREVGNKGGIGPI